MYLRVPCTDESGAGSEDIVAEEVKVKIYGNGKLYAFLNCSPSFLAELGAGYVVCEGYASFEGIDDVRVDGCEVYVTHSGRFERKMPDVSVELEEIFDLVNRLSESEVWRVTGGTHSAVVVGSRIYRAEDVSRSCAFDKVVGHLALNDDRAKIAAVSCRLTEVIVRKAVNACIPVLVSKAAVTTAGIRAAEEGGVTLVGFVRERKAKIYSHPWRITKFK